MTVAHRSFERLYRKASPELTDRLFFMLKEVFSQSRVRRKRFPGLIMSSCRETK